MSLRPNVNMENSGNGTRPKSTSLSFGLVLVTKITDVCGKFLLLDTRYRAVIYCNIAFVGSLIADFMSIPQWHFSKKDTFLNRQFAKMPEVWLLATMILWIVLTAYTLNCGRIIAVAKHLVRPLVATAVPHLFWVIFCDTISVYVGRCLNTTDPLLRTRPTCVKAGMSWNGPYMSGHMYRMTYHSLTLAAEGSTFVGWDGITDLIAREENTRNKCIMVTLRSRPLENLSSSDLVFLKKTHRLVTPYVRVLFICMTLLQACCDLVIMLTVISHYHDMVEKVLGVFGGILIWYVNYCCLTKLPAMRLPAPSEGLFKYNESNNKLNPDSIPAPVRTIV